MGRVGVVVYVVECFARVAALAFSAGGGVPAEPC